jgi:hypothetical protein
MEARPGAPSFLPAASAACRPLRRADRGQRVAKLTHCSACFENDWRFAGLPSARPHAPYKYGGMLLESDYIHTDPPKALPPMPMRVSRSSQLTVALRQHARPIVIEDQELARQFVRLLRACEFVARTMSHAIGRSYGANIEAHWYVGQYVLPGNVQKVFLKPKPYDAERLPRHLQA